MTGTLRMRRALPIAIAVVGAGALLLLLERLAGEGPTPAALGGVEPGPAESAFASPAAAPAGGMPGTSARIEQRPEAGSLAQEAEQELDSFPAPARRHAGEREHHQEFLEVARRDPDLLAEETPEVLRGDSPDYRKVALLRVLHETGSPAAEAGFALAMRELEDGSSPHASSVPQFAVRYLGERAEEDATARATLRAVAFGPGRTAAGSVRLQAARHLARASTEAELFELAPHVRLERDELTRAVFAAGLLSNPEERTVALLFSDLLAARESFAGDSSQHQDLDSQ